MGSLMLLDTASLYYRAFYGVPDTVTAPDGTPVNAVRAAGHDRALGPGA
jgi:5'-3' exonuclease